MAVWVQIVVLCLVFGVPAALAGWAPAGPYERFPVRDRDVAESPDSIEEAGENGVSTTLSPAADLEAETAPDADDWDCVGLSVPVELSARDRDYYRASWTHILGTFTHWPTVGLDLAGRLTVNLMRNRGVVPDDANLSSELPANWRFPTAQGFRAAQDITRRVGESELARDELSKALMLYRALFEEILEAPTSADSMQ